MKIRDKKCQRWAKEIAYQIEVLAIKPCYLSLIIGTHVIEGKKKSFQNYHCPRFQTLLQGCNNKNCMLLA